LRFQKQSVRN